MKQRLAHQLLLFFLLLQQNSVIAQFRRKGFIEVQGTNFMLNGLPYYANGFNSYSLMYQAAADPSGRAKVSALFRQAAKRKLSILRTWAFSDGSGLYMPLQYHPGSYNEQMFQGLDYVVAEARKYNIKLILSLVNNYHDYGGKQQYVNWGNELGLQLTSADDFYTHPVLKQFYKNHVQAVVNRLNTITGTIYKNERTIMAWELMNEPRCADPSGQTIQRWIEEMASYVKSIDENHLLEVGTEGFYGSSSGRTNINPLPSDYGTDFIANNLVPAIDFATHHSYPDSWLPGSTEQNQLAFLSQWLDAHISDAQNILKKPVLMTEFGKPTKNTNYTQRDTLFGLVYSKIHESAQLGGPAAGSLFWHLIDRGMDNFRDDYAIILDDENSSTTAGIIAREARKLFKIRKMYYHKRKWEMSRRDRATRDQSLVAHP